MAEAGRRRPQVIVRKATDADLDELVRMAVELQNHVEASNPKIWRMSEAGSQSKRVEMMNALRDPEGIVVVATSGEGELVGMATGRILRKEEMTVKVAGSIERVIVGKKWRGGGIGTRLVAALSSFFDEKGVGDITVRYVLGNVEGEAFWKGLGFEPRIEIANIGPGKLRQELRKRMGSDETP